MGPSTDAAQFEQVILPIIATGVDGTFDPIGTGFVISVFEGGREALMLSAAHNFAHIARLDDDSRVHLHGKSINLRHTKMYAQFADTEGRGHLARIRDALFNNATDIALCVLHLEDHIPESIQFEKKLVIDTSPIRIRAGTPITAIGYAEMSSEVVVRWEANEADANFHYKLDFRRGKVTAVYPTKGPRIQPWPCFQCSVPFYSGMSGGPIINKDYGDLIVACGLICSDLSYDATGTTSGSEAIAALLWPAMNFTVKHAMVGEVPAEPTLLDLHRLNYIDDRGDPCQHITFDETDDNGNVIIRWSEGPPVS